ncbi:uncharacterized protein H6S33_012403 [Morchella sextelata]|uniref:uncharacterized protein n=1 Tax=Morchella sextelata TaxID=1174677 RepID=UPI001D040732|nr:uncharacterized protein H6S33_012403 [Morchella sextelata]KAH0609857.1 hypothetical protein H6S33_012403 [Morchella sextelata]
MKTTALFASITLFNLANAAEFTQLNPDTFARSINSCYEQSTQAITPPSEHTNFTQPMRRPHIAHEAEVDCICQLPEFAPTVENWWTSGATEWIKEYTLLNSEKKRFQELGIVGFIAEDLLKKTNFRCDVESVHRCVVECQDVVRKVADPEVARRVWFILRSAGNIVEVSKMVHDSLVAAQLNMAQLVPVIADTFYWTPGMDDQTWALIFTHTVNTLSFLFGQFFPMARGMIQINQLLDNMASAAAENAAIAETNLRLMEDEFLAVPEYGVSREERDLLFSRLESHEESLAYWTKKSECTGKTARISKMGFTDILVGQIGSGISNAFGTLNSYISFEARHPGYEKPRETNKMGLDAFIRSSSMRARGALREGINVIFSGALAESDGSSIFSNFTMAGNFLPDRSGDAQLWRDIGAETGLTRGLMLKTLNAAINSQAVYITCSKDYRRTATDYRPTVEKQKAGAANCKKDNSGPKDFKACVEGYCCYIYKWNNRGWAPSWRNDKLFGADVIDDEPWNVKITDIITSSVQAYIHGIREITPTYSLTAGIFRSLRSDNVGSLWDPTTPGMFTVPVCFSTHNWATVIDGYRFPINGHIDAQPRNSVKNLPCNCGPWGKDTEQVWKEVGLWNLDPNDRWFNDYTTSKCGYQIYDKIEDPLEKYVAYCRVKVGTTWNFRIRSAGEHWNCPMVLNAIKKLGYPDVMDMKENDPDVYQALWCHAIHPGSSRKECKNYNEPLSVTMVKLGKWGASEIADEIELGPGEEQLVKMVLRDGHGMPLTD